MDFTNAKYSSIERVKQKWLPEVRHYMPNTPIILVGTKKDLRDTYFSRPHAMPEISRAHRKEAGQHLADQMKATEYLECSALTKEGLDHVFEATVRAKKNTDRRHPRRRWCFLF